LKLPLRQLARHLERAPAPAYLIAGDEPLLVTQGVDLVRRAARRAGFDEHELYVIDRSFRWTELEAGADNLSLFGSRRIIELRMPTAKPGEAGASCIRGLVERLDPDRILIVAIGTKLDSAAGRSVWVNTIEKHGVVVDVWPVERGELPDWIRLLAAALGLKLSNDAADLLADRVEGNLLAADQELVKLAMTMPDTTVGEAEVLEAVADNARFDVFRLTDALVTGDSVRALRVLSSLRAEGVQPTLVNWAVSREIALLARLQFAVAHGEHVDNALARLGVWRRRQPILKQALRRFAGRSMTPLLARAADADSTIKGIIRGRPWEATTALAIAVLTHGGAALPTRH
jgi:DNA polymerase-3 subunit delta